MDEIDKLGLQAGLVHLKCALRHHESDPPQQAVTYIYQGFGYQKDEVVSEITDELVIPVCQYCLDSLDGGEWAILICASCLESRWVPIISAPMKIDWKVKFTPLCPVCYDNKRTEKDIR
jgi:hypothetical protein